jgi:phenylacetate-CoA ligase
VRELIAQRRLNGLGFLAPLAARLPAAWKYGQSFSATTMAISRAETDGDWLIHQRNEAVRDLVDSAVARSAFYARRRGAFGPAISDWPPIARSELLDHADEMVISPQKAMNLVNTSGSSGRPLALYLDKTRRGKEWAFVLNYWSKAGYSHSDWRLVLRGVDHKSGGEVTVDPFLREIRCSTFVMNDKVLKMACDHAKSLGCRYIHGYPSAIAILLRYVRSNNDDFGPSVRGVFPVSEPLGEGLQTELANAFPNAMVVPFYGLTEKVAIAGVPRNREVDGYEFHPLYGYAELLDEENQAVVTAGRPGRIVSTGLLSTGMPLIRYETGDRAILVHSENLAQNQWLTVDSIGPRRGVDVLHGKDGTEISTTGLTAHSSAYLRIQAFQFSQSAPGFATLHVVPAHASDLQAASLLASDFERKCHGNLAVRGVTVEDIPPGPNGKRDMVVHEP